MLIPPKKTGHVKGFGYFWSQNWTVYTASWTVLAVKNTINTWFNMNVLQRHVSWGDTIRYTLKFNSRNYFYDLSNILSLKSWVLLSSRRSLVGLKCSGKPVGKNPPSGAPQNFRGDELWSKTQKSWRLKKQRLLTCERNINTDMTPVKTG